MFEQIIAFSAGYLAALFITMMVALAIFGAYWAKTGVYSK
jgi:hypothetical protein